MTGVLIKRGEDTKKHREGHIKMHAGTGVTCYKPRNTKYCQGRGNAGIFSRGLERV